MGAFSYLSISSQFATFGLFLFVVVLIFYMRNMFSSVENQYKEFQSRLKEFHRDEYVSDTNVDNPALVVPSHTVAAYYRLAKYCKEIYRIKQQDGLSDDARILCELVEDDNHEDKYLLVTVRGTKTLEDLLWDSDIFGISPGHDLLDNEGNLLTELVRTFSDGKAKGGVAEMITELLTWSTSDEDGTPDVLHFSHGVWILAKRVLVHLSKYSKTQETVDFSKTQVLLAGHSLGGGAAFLTTLVLSCIRPNETPIACVTFGQPRVLVTPLDRGPEPSRRTWQIQKRTIMAHLSNDLSRRNIYYHRIVTDEDPIALLPTRVPRAMFSSGEKFVHVPEAIVIREDGENVKISRECSTSTAKIAHAVALSFLRSVATILLHRSHKMTSYIRLLNILVEDEAFVSDRHYPFYGRVDYNWKQSLHSSFYFSNNT